MTSDDKYNLLIRNIRRRINDVVVQSPVDGEQPPVFDNDDLKDEIDLAISFIAGEEDNLDITTVKRQHYEMIIMRAWLIICKILAFDSAKFFYMQQTNQTYDKGQRTRHYLDVADNLEKLLEELLERQGFAGGAICVGDINILNREDLKEETRVSDNPPDPVFFTKQENMEGATGFVTGDRKLFWERSNEWDFWCYKIYKGYTPDVNKDTGSIVETIQYNYTTELLINIADETEENIYYVIYVVDNRNQFSKVSEWILVENPTGST